MLEEKAVRKSSPFPFSLDPKTLKSPAASAPLKSIKEKECMDAIDIGTVVEALDEGQQPPRIEADDPRWQKHLRSPWLRDYIHEKLAIDTKDTHLNSSRERVGEALLVTDSMLGHHSVLVGKTGSGKSFLARHLIAEQLRAGYSLVAFEPKQVSVMRLLEQVRLAGVPPERVTLILPERGVVGMPGWNLLESPLPLSTNVAMVLQALRELFSDSWGNRMHSILESTLIVMTVLRLSLLEVAHFLQNTAYRTMALRRAEELAPALPVGERHQVRLALRSLNSGFHSWSASEQAKAADPILNKLQQLLSHPYLSALFCAEGNALDLPKLWQEQRVILVHLSSSCLGSTGVRVIGGILTDQLYHTALSTIPTDTTVPVVLSLDEMAFGERSIGRAATDILAIAREYRLRLLAVCQHLDQLSDELRHGLLTNTSLQVFFAQQSSDAKVTASSLCLGTGELVERVVVEQGVAGVTLARRYPIVDGLGRQLSLSHASWAAYLRYERQADEPLRGLAALGQCCGVPKLYVLSGASATGIVPLSRLVAGVPYRIVLARPLIVEVSPPRPRLREIKRSESQRTEQLARTIINLGSRQAIVWRSGASSAQVEVLALPEIDVLGTGVKAFTQKVLERQDKLNPMEATLLKREAAMDRLARGEVARDKEPERETVKEAKEPLESGLAEDGSLI